MKTNFLVKLFLLSIVCVSLHSCTVDETTSSPPTHATDSPSAADGDPILIPPRK